MSTFAIAITATLITAAALAGAVLTARGSRKGAALNPGLFKTGNPPLAGPRKPAPSSSTIARAHMDGADREHRAA